MQPEPIHQAFAAGLIDPDAPLPDGVVDPQGQPAPKRYGVYRNNVTVSLVEALKAAFPAASALIGEGPFSQVALEFVRRHPPTSAVMLHYGKGFDAFLETLNPLKHLPFLPDIARLELAWLSSYHAADAKVLDARAMTTIAADDWDQVRFLVHPAVCLIRSDYPIVSIWAGAKAGTLKDISQQAQWALITRPDVQVSVHAISAADGVFLDALSGGALLAEAVEKAQAVSPDFDLQTIIGTAFAAGLFKGFEVGQHE